MVCRSLYVKTVVQGTAGIIKWDALTLGLCQAHTKAMHPYPHSDIYLKYIPISPCAYIVVFVCLFLSLYIPLSRYLSLPHSLWCASARAPSCVRARRYMRACAFGKRVCLTPSQGFLLKPTFTLGHGEFLLRPTMPTCMFAIND